jgi:hypothetical protein
MTLLAEGEAVSNWVFSQLATLSSDHLSPSELSVYRTERMRAVSEVDALSNLDHLDRCEVTFERRTPQT